ncbi:hypothetical protein WN59_06755 [Salinicoccus sediminis]|uniref:IrrE N-terminal-like domain-containing protein n=1 Tax=Salinicoccus sediminis TaxID=1432562 RepID=A0A0M2SKE1_9STAP|nr:ImmA/IrrE family metallo-endopeptidase [Salinicoccus sediminis]KKK34723.1 hypothetical protein WN59_06755 [Salinicoccus sediminis]
MKKLRLSETKKEELNREADTWVRKFKTEYPLVKYPINDPFAEVEKLGYFIIAKKVESEIAGLQYKIGDDGYILINNNDDLGRQHHSLFHEVFHLYSGVGLGVHLKGESEYIESEYLADAFASRLLMDRSLVQKYIDENRVNIEFLSHVDLIRMHNYFNVSYSNMAFVLKQMFPDEFNPVMFAIGKLPRRSDLLKKTKDTSLSTKLSEVPEFDYITPSIFETLSSNLESGRVSEERIEEILDFFSEELNLGE